MPFQAAVAARLIAAANKGCQIFLGATYQNWENIYNENSEWP
jgi:hypothetical protein